jgi:exopolysaccharide/PEP-CTERM locus tyrosine autokinase
MNKHSALRTESLLERAAELYGFAVPSSRAADPREPAAPRIAPEPAPRRDPAPVQPDPRPASESITPPPRRPMADREPGPAQQLDRKLLRAAGFIEPEAPVGALAEEFRIVKRRLLLGVSANSAVAAGKKQTVLICSSQPGEGKTFAAINLALSLAGERDTEVLLVDADFNKPAILSTLGLQGERGLVDALADPFLDPESLVIRTDVRGLSVLPAGRSVTNVTELLASGRTPEVLDLLTRDRPRRIVLFDSPPALLASPAAVLASHVGQLLMVVRADSTTEADLREALGLLSGCAQVSLLLNGTGFAASGRRFGSYYGIGQ